jgi:hypothetical protein
MYGKAKILACLLLVYTSSCMSPDFINGEKGWVLLGERKVNHLFEKDVFRIKSRDKFTSVRLYVSERDVDIKDVEIMLVNGDILKPSIESTIRQGDRSRIIDLAADGRQLETITVRYRSAGKIFSHKGNVQIGGRPHNPNDNY